jgi:biopolymer transport protein ExbD
MAIVSPGKRPAKRFESSRILGGKMSRGRKATNAELNVVPMVDMMTMLVIFLLQQFSATGEVLYMQKDIKLPDAHHGQMIEVAPVVTISANEITVVGKKVADIADLERDSYLNIPGIEEGLRDEKKKWEFMHQRDQDKQWKGVVNVQADGGVPYRIVRRVLHSCEVAGYSNHNLATLDAGSIEAVSQGQPIGGI